MARMHTGARQGLPGTHIFIFTCEIWAVELVHSHDHSHNVLAVHNRSGQDIPCFVGSQLIGKGAEVGALRARGKEDLSPDTPPCWP